MTTQPNDREQAYEPTPEERNREDINGRKPAGGDKSPGAPENEQDPHRGITDTPSQHEELSTGPGEAEEDDMDEDDTALDEELEDLDEEEDFEDEDDEENEE
jgi:hypothetical protein